VTELQQRIARQRHDEQHYGRHALEPGHPAYGIPAQRAHDPSAATTRLFSGDVFVPSATQ
jgi:hypothetical protein